MAARRGLVRTARAGSLATVAVLSGLLTGARAELLTPPAASTAASEQSGSFFGLTLPFPFDDRIPVLIDARRGIGPVTGWRLQLAFRLDYLDLPLIPARGSGVSAFVGTSTQSLGGFRLHF